MLRYLADFFQDLRYARRVLMQSSAFSAVAILTLALGIAANTAVFSIVHGALLRPLPYRDPHRLVDILDRSTRESRLSKLFDSYSDYRAFGQHAASFEELGAATWALRLPVLSGRGPARRVTAIGVSESFFHLLGVQPLYGRTFSPGDGAGGCAVVLSHAFWTKLFSSDPRIAGQSITLDRRDCKVAGVMPAGFAFYPQAAEMWSLITPDLPNLDETAVFIFGRLKPGVARGAAESELLAIHTALHHADGRERELSPVVDDLQEEFTWLAGRNLRTTLWVLLGAVGMVLLIACLNIASLLLGRGIARGRELAIRAAVGCRRGRLIRQLLTEGLLLASIGGGLGIFGADAALRYFRSVNPVEMPAGTTIAISAPILLFTSGITIVTALLFGIAPAWKASRVDLNVALKSAGRAVGGPGRYRLARLLVVAEMALSVALLSGAGLLLESVARMGSAPLGFDQAHLYSAAITLPEVRYGSPAQRARFFEELEARIAGLPSVQSTTVTSALPPYGVGNSAIEILGRPVPGGKAIHDVGRQWISPAYFQTLGVALKRGRNFDWHDREGSEPVVIVDEALAREYFPGEDPIGRRIRIAEAHERPWATIVGVAASQKHTSLFQEMSWIEAATVFSPIAQDPPVSVSLAIRTAGTAVPLATAVSAMDAEIAIGEVVPVEQTFSRLLAYPRFRALLLGSFAGFALLLAGIGLHGVLGQLVNQRTQEIGVRLALGARPVDVVRLIALHGGVPVLAGLAVGVAAALALSRFLAAFLYGIRPRDPLTLAAASGVLLITAVLAIAFPARRAAGTDPMAALRLE